MTVDRSTFFTRVRPLFAGELSQGQVDGMTAILDAWEAWLPGNADLNPNIRWLAYALATAFHETARAMQPVAEYGHGAHRDYGLPDPVTHQVYYGRGLVQLTWKANYQLQGARLGLDLEHNPDLALGLDAAADIMLHGMAAGSFTGRRLGQYFGANPANDNPNAARRIINGLDQATLIAGYHRVFLTALVPPTQLQSVTQGA
ncbi:glycoside hydrolase family 19 protein [Acidisphaera sp. L21]|uniref:glycoside hydrolase family 19 protein n=1 Tax=Acidisphaera sp. L21 TaxID=1641851 RepID=UPI00131C6CAC|nr:glycoside hydrolase family 19 protein [Acidisphaera sp. L21]